MPGDATQKPGPGAHTVCVSMSANKSHQQLDFNFWGLLGSNWLWLSLVFLLARILTKK